MLSEDSPEGESAHCSITLAYNAERREIEEWDLWICKYWLAWYSLRMPLCGLKSPIGFKKPEYLWNASEGLQALKSFWDMRQWGEVQRQWCCSTPLTQDKQQGMTGYKSGVGLHHVEEFKGEEERSEVWDKGRIKLKEAWMKWQRLLENMDHNTKNLGEESQWKTKGEEALRGERVCCKRSGGGV